MSYVDRLFDLSGRVVLVTGATSGIGQALAGGLARAGARVVVNGRDQGKIDRTLATFAGAGLAAAGANFDVTDSAAVAAGVARIEDEIGPIDVLINNAGIQRRAPLQDFEEATWKELMATNLDAVFLMGREVARRMIPRARGSIINICSVNSELGRPTIAPYVASKGAVKMLTKGMSIDWGRHGIRVNGIGPGYFRTELNMALYQNEAFSAWLTGRTPLGRWGEVDELVGAAIYLASDAASFVTGHVLYVDGGVTATL